MWHEQANVNVRVGGALRAFMLSRIGTGGSYDNASEYIRDLIRRDMESKHSAWAALETQLSAAISAMPSTYRDVTADDVIARNIKSSRKRRS